MLAVDGAQRGDASDRPRDGEIADVAALVDLLEEAASAVAGQQGGGDPVVLAVEVLAELLRVEAVDLAVVLVNLARVRDGKDGGEVEKGDAGGIDGAASLNGLDGQVRAGVLRLGQTQRIDVDTDDKLLLGIV
jgi:hypothetical protein